MILNIKRFSQAIANVSRGLRILDISDSAAARDGKQAEYRAGWRPPTIIPPFSLLSPSPIFYRLPKQIAILLQTLVGKMKLGGQFPQVNFSFSGGIQYGDNGQCFFGVRNLTIFF